MILHHCIAQYPEVKPFRGTYIVVAQIDTCAIVSGQVQ